MKATAISHPDIAFIKYWGKKEGKEGLRLPVNGSISMVLSDLTTKTTVEFSDAYTLDIVEIEGKMVGDREKERVIKHLNRIRTLAEIKLHAKVSSTCNFPMSAGISSSASGFSALTVAGAKAAGLDLSKRELSILARKASGSACRPILDGFVEWKNGDTDETSYAETIFSPDHWDIADVVALISYQKKTIPTTMGMSSAHSSPFFQQRTRRMDQKLREMKNYLENKDFKSFGELIESEALEMHAISLTSQPPLIYWLPETIIIMRAVQQWRKEGLPVYFTINTGQNVHILVEGKNVDILKQKLHDIKEVQEIYVNKPSEGAHLIEDHLF